MGENEWDKGDLYYSVSMEVQTILPQWPANHGAIFTHLPAICWFNNRSSPSTSPTSHTPDDFKCLEKTQLDAVIW